MDIELVNTSLRIKNKNYRNHVSKNIRRFKKHIYPFCGLLNKPVFSMTDTSFLLPALNHNRIFMRRLMKFYEIRRFRSFMRIKWETIMKNGHKETIAIIILLLECLCTHSYRRKGISVSQCHPGLRRDTSKMSWNEEFIFNKWTPHENSQSINQYTDFGCINCITFRNIGFTLLSTALVALKESYIEIASKEWLVLAWSTQK